VAEAPPEPRRSQAVAEGGLTHKRARRSKDIGDTGTSRTRTEHPTSRNRRLTKHEQQGPRAKIMLYPYYATLIATSGGTSSNPHKCSALQRLTTPQPPCTWCSAWSSATRPGTRFLAPKANGGSGWAGMMIRQSTVL